LGQGSKPAQSSKAQYAILFLYLEQKSSSSGFVAKCTRVFSFRQNTIKKQKKIPLTTACRHPIDDKRKKAE
jgi:hypothetical protein